ncbi:MAG: efflux RND transporter periplasmic adaptor subunit [Bacteroidota bacterium]
MNKTLKRILYSVLALFILAIIIYPKLPDFGKDEQQEAAGEKEKKLLKVNAVIANYEPLESIVKITGSVLADESVDLNSEVSATVKEIHFEEGDEAKQGQLLLTLNDDEIVAELEKERFTKKLREDNERRQKQLLDKEAISQEEYEISLTEYNTSLAQIKVLEARLQKYRIRAPFGGFIGLRSISVGSYVNPGEMIATLYKTNPVKLDFAIPGRYLEKVNKGDKLYFTVDGYDETFEGAIYAIEPQIDPETRSLKLRAISQNPEGKLLPGQFAKIRLVLESIEESIQVPTQSIIPELNGKRIFVYASGIVESRSITTGIRSEENIQVLTGLQPGDTVITSGILQLRQGMEVDLNI